MCRYRIFAFFTAIYPKITLKSVKGIWHCHCLHPKDFQTITNNQQESIQDAGREERRRKRRKKKRASFSSNGSSSLAWEYNRLSSLIAAWDVDASPAKRPWRRGARSKEWLLYSKASSTWQKLSSQTKTCFLPFLSTFAKTHSLLHLIITWQRQV